MIKVVTFQGEGNLSGLIGDLQRIGEKPTFFSYDSGIFPFYPECPVLRDEVALGVNDNLSEETIQGLAKINNYEVLENVN